MSNGQVVPTKLPSNYAEVRYKEIKISHHPASARAPTPVLVLTLHRPQANNAFTDVMTDELEHFFRIAWSNAKIGFVFSQRGVVMEGCSSFFLPRLIGAARAQQLVIPGKVHLASDRRLDGLFYELCDKQEDVLPAALKEAEELAADTSTVSTFMNREMIFRGVNSAEEAHLLESRVMGSMRGKADNNEAVDAFLQKRRAQFTGTMQDDAPSVYPWFSRVHVKNPAVAEPSTTGRPRL